MSAIRFSKYLYRHMWGKYARLEIVRKFSNLMRLMLTLMYYMLLVDHNCNNSSHLSAV